MKRRLILVAVAALAPAVTILAYNEFAGRRALSAQIGTKALEYNRQASSEIDRILEGVRALLVATSALPSVRDAEANPEPCRDALTSVVSAAPWIRTILVLNSDGQLVCDTLGTASVTNFADRAYFQEAMRGTDFYVGEYTNSRLSSSPILPVSTPLRDKSGAIRGVVATAIRLDWFNERLRERGIGAGNALTIADREGVIIARNPDADRFVGTKIPAQFMRLVRAEKAGVLDVISQDGTARVLGYSPSTHSPFGLYVSVGLSKDEAFAERDRQTAVGVLSIILGVLVALVAAWFAGGLIRRPVTRIARVMDDWKQGVTGSRTGLKGEVGDVEFVGESLDQLLDELARRQQATLKAEEQRDLVMRELAHRVKNTLALVQAIANQSFGRQNQEGSQAFNERLVALAGAYDVLLGDNFRSGSMEAIIRTTLRPHLTGADRIEIHGPAIELTPQNALSLSLVIHELATNATKYGALSSEKGVVEVTWKARADQVDLSWNERGGPLVVAPQHAGFGSRLIKRAFGAEAQARVEVEYRPEGVQCSISFKRDVIGSPA